MCALAVVLAGCDLVFPSTPAQLDAPGERADAPPPPVVAGTIVHRSVVSLASGAPMPTSAGLGPVTATVRLADDGELVVPVDPSGAFAFERPAGPYRLSFARSGSETLEIQDASPTLAFAEIVAGRESAAPLGPSTTVLFPVPAAQPVVVSTGQFTQTPLAGTTMSWASALAVGRVPLGLLDSSANDVLYYFDVATGTDVLATQPFARILRMFAARVTMTGAANETIDLRARPLVTPGANLCRRITAPRADIRRFLAIQPEFSTTTTDWLVQAVPDRAHSQLGALDVFAAFGSGTQAIDVEPAGFNPWAGQYQLVASTGAVHTRTYKHPQARNPAVFGPAMRVYATVDDGNDCTAQTIVASDIAFASDIAIDGVILATDDTTLARPASDPTIAWTPTTGATDRWEATLFEVIRSGNDTSFRAIRSIHTTATRAALDRRDLVSGRRYLVRVTAFRGHPGAATGDYATIAYPYATAQAFTRVFAVP